MPDKTYICLRELTNTGNLHILDFYRDVYTIKNQIFHILETFHIQENSDIVYWGLLLPGIHTLVLLPGYYSLKCVTPGFFELRTLKFWPTMREYRVVLPSLRIHEWKRKQNCEIRFIIRLIETTQPLAYRNERNERWK